MKIKVRLCIFDHWCPKLGSPKVFCVSGQLILINYKTKPLHLESGQEKKKKSRNLTNRKTRGFKEIWGVTFLISVLCISRALNCPLNHKHHSQLDWRWDVPHTSEQMCEAQILLEALYHPLPGLSTWSTAALQVNANRTSFPQALMLMWVTPQHKEISLRAGTGWPLHGIPRQSALFFCPSSTSPVI